MRYILLSLLTLFIFSGCCFKTPEKVIIKEYETIVIYPDDSNYLYYNAPKLPRDLSTKSQDEVLNILIPYTVKLQTTVQLYENRTKSLIQWRDDMQKVRK